MIDTATATVTPLPVKPDFRALAVNGKVTAKDPTAALRQKRRRAKRKAAAAVAPSIPAVAAVTGEQIEKPNETKPDVTVRHGASHSVDRLAYVAALALAGAAAWFSIRGMVVLFPGSPVAVIAMACAMEGAKLATAGWLSRSWRATAWIWRGVLVVLVAGLAVINAAGVYAQLVAAHVGERGAAQAAVQMQGADVDARIEVAAGRVADLDRRISQIDAAVAAATQRGRTTTALAAMENQRQSRRPSLASGRKRRALLPPSRRSALTWRCRAVSPKARRRPSSTSRKCSVSAVTASGRFAG
jgi:hypothetical protein